MFTTSSGLQIAYLGGAYNKKSFAVPNSDSGPNLVRKMVLLKVYIFSVYTCVCHEFLEAIFLKARCLQHHRAVLCGQVQRSGHPTDLRVAEGSR